MLHCEAKDYNVREQFTFLSVFLVQKENNLVFCHKQCTSSITDKHTRTGEKSRQWHWNNSKISILLARESHWKWAFEFQDEEQHSWSAEQYRQLNSSLHYHKAELSLGILCMCWKCTVLCVITHSSTLKALWDANKYPNLSQTSLSNMAESPSSTSHVNSEHKPYVTQAASPGFIQ